MAGRDRSRLRARGGLFWWLLALLSLALPSQAVDSERNVKFSRLTIDDGLSQAFVNSVIQDSRGFMWFGTQEGLNLYDGVDFTVFAHDASDPNSLSHDLVKVLVEDSDGFLWIGTDGGGLNRLDPATRTFLHLQHDPSDPASLGHDRVWTLLEDSAGRLWVGTDGGGLYRLDRANLAFHAYRHDPGDPRSLGGNEVRALAEDRAGGIWVGTDGGGLSRLDPSSGVWQQFRHDPGDPSSLASDSVRALFVDGVGHLWVGTSDRGLDRLEPGSLSFIHYRHDESDPQSLAADGVRALFESRDGVLWVGTHEGLSRLQRSTGAFHTLRHSPTDPHSLSNNRIVSIFEDSGGVLWVGTFNGLNFWNTSSGHFLHYRTSERPNTGLSESYVNAFAENRDGEIWIGTLGGGLNRLDPETGAFSYLRADPENPRSLGDDRVMSLLMDRHDVLWVGTLGAGLHRLDRGGNDFTRFENDPDDPSSLSFNGVTVMLEDSLGDLWIGTYKGGLNRFDRRSGTFERFLHDPEDATSLSSNRVLALHEDSLGNLWVGTYGAGLNLLDRASGSFRVFRHRSDDANGLSKDEILSLYEDGDGNLWIGTQGGGLNKWSLLDRRALRPRFHRLTTRDGLRSNTVNSIVEDDSGDLWFSSNNGLTRLPAGSGTPVVYDTSHGLLNEFNYGAGLKARNGRIYFGGIEGFNAFHPRKIVRNRHVPPVVLTRVLKAYEEIPIESWSLATRSVELGYRDTVISFEFAALDYTAPEKNLYRHKLDGFDADWVDAGSLTRATYTNLGAGEYTFRVVGSNNDGIWNETGTRISIRVLPPPWRTWWAYVAYALVAVAVVAGNGRSQAKKRQRAEELALANSALQEEIVQRQEKENALRTEKEKAQQYLDVADVIMLGLDKDARVGVINQKGAEVLGFAEEEILGEDWCSRFVKPEEQAGVRAFLREGGFAAHTEYSLISRIGEERIVAWHTTFQYDEEGRLSGSLSSGTDVTQLLRLREEKESAEIANQAKSQFLANMSHEIRTPMNGVLGMIELLSHSGLNDRQRHFADSAQRAANALLELLNDILDVSKIEAGKLELEIIDFEPRRLVDDVAVLFSQQARRKGFALEVEIDEEVSQVVVGDSIRVRQVLSNLVGNAVKFTESGRVAVRVKPCWRQGRDGQIRFEVEDTGIGMTPDQVEAVFEPFRQADGSTTRRFGGTGLGLTIAKQLVELMGGNIGVESRPGEGTLLWFEVPFSSHSVKKPSEAGAATAARDSEPAEILPAALAKARIMLVEDNVLNQEVVRGMLSHLGGRADVADCGGKALELFEQHRYDLVLMDCQMPGMDGYEATRRIRELEASAPRSSADGGMVTASRVPIVAMTASALAGDRERCLASGMDDYLGKPFKLEQLVRLLEHWLPLAGGATHSQPEPADGGTGASPSIAGQPDQDQQIAKDPSPALEESDSPIDFEALESIRALESGGSSMLLHKVITVYLESSPDLVVSLRQGAESGDADTVHRAAHSLKSTSASLGAMHLSTLCRELELLAGVGSLDGVADLVGRVEREFDRVVAALSIEDRQEEAS